ncbi:MAG TPA: glucose 1-dehydrogenase [Candidatus Saccharimonadales bacterium]|nr:glucose 1-dehydrogenase [Candidatus Saccharimonadales bacterium]
MSSMQAVAVFPARREVRLIDHPAPEFSSPTQVRLRMLEAGICGTDREICSFQYGTPPAGSEYLVLGHESLGQVVEVGAQVTRVKPGDLVVPMVRRPCARPDCLACRAGRQDFCSTGEFTERGINGAHGYLTAEVVDEERYMVPVPAALREVGVLTEPLTIAEKALAQVWEVQDRLPWECRHGRGLEPDRTRTAVVLGAGPVGLLGAMVLRAAGYRTFLYSLGLEAEGRGALAESIGVTGVPAESVPVTELPARVGNIDLVYEATGASRVAFEVLTALGANGIFVFTGVPGRRGSVELDTDTVMRDLVLRNQVVLGTVNAGRAAYDAAVRDLARFVERWPGAARGLITRRVPMEGSLDALQGRAGGIKTVVELA